jgi:hypothetical protein
MTAPALTPLHPEFATTRDALHRLAVYVISPAQRFVNGEIILTATPGGFGTALLPAGQIRVDGTDLVDTRSGAERRAPITTLNEMAAFAGIEPDVAQGDEFDVPPAGDLDEQLAVDADAAANLAAWYRFTTDLLDELRAEAGAADDATPVRLWPEHFDAAIDLGAQDRGHRGTYGGSPGDRHIAQPYLYVSPWAGRIDPFFGEPGFKGAALGYDRIAAGAADPARFLRDARGRIAAH